MNEFIKRLLAQSPPSIKPAYFLRKGGHYERDHKWLDEQERDNARQFFHAFQMLSEADQQLLAAKYRSDERWKNGSDVPVNDEDLAAANSMDLNDYRQLRRGAEQRLAEAIKHECHASM